MSKLNFLGCACMLALAALATPAFAQYMYLDANGDGINTTADSLNPAGPTVLTVYLNTNHDRDGSLQTCNGHTAAATAGGPIDLFSYTIVLKATDGTVEWGAFTPDNPAFTPLGSDLVGASDTQFTRMRPSGTVTPAGLGKLGTITATITSDAPRIDVGTSTPLDPTGFGTGFGTHCEGSEFPNTYVLGTDWFDIDGVGSSTSDGNEAPSASVPATLTMTVGEPVQLAGEFSDPNPGDSLRVNVEGYPPGLFPVNGNQTDGARQVRLYGIPDRSIAPGQHYSIEWSVSDGESSLTATSDVQVQGGSPAPNLGSTVAKYLTAHHLDGMSRSQIRAFGAPALPILAQMLRDDRYKGIWHRITGAIGFVGDTAYFDTLHAFIWDRFQGEVDSPTYMAIQSAQASLNAMATASPRAFSYLAQTVNPSAWGGLRWSVQPYSARRVAVAMTRMSIVALGYTDSGAAGAILRGLAENPYDPWQLIPTRDAIRQNDQVRSIGFTKVWESEDPPPVSIK